MLFPPSNCTFTILQSTVLILHCLKRTCSPVCCWWDACLDWWLVWTFSCSPQICAKATREAHTNTLQAFKGPFQKRAPFFAFIFRKRQPLRHGLLMIVRCVLFQLLTSIKNETRCLNDKELLNINISFFPKVEYTRISLLKKGLL